MDEETYTRTEGGVSTGGPSSQQNQQGKNPNLKLERFILKILI